jgi:hypothetical protein
MSDTEQELKPGRSTDRLCAAKLGYEWLELDGAFGSVGRWVEPGSQNSAYDLKMRYTEGIDQPRYSTSMDDAMDLIENLHDRCYWTKLLMHYSPANNYQCLVGSKAEINGWGWSPADYSAEASTPALAICLAFLGVEGKGGDE